MKTITEQFLSGIKWNTIEACLYQGILWGYHVTLFKVLDRSLYGTVGILFSLLYIGVTLCTLGLDSALSPFIRQYTGSKTAFRHLLMIQWIPNLILYGGLILLGYYGDLNHFFALFGIPPLDQSLILILILLLIIESIKRIAKTYLGLLFYNQTLASLEIAYISLYVCTIAICSYAGLPISLLVIYLPMLVVSALFTTIFIILCVKNYQTLADGSYTPQPGLARRITRARFYGYINQVGHVIFSGNMFVTLSGAQLGLAYAAVAKIISTSIQSISTITHKVIGQSSEAALAHAHAYATHEKQSLFALANSYAQTVIFYLFACLCILNYKTVAAHVMINSLHTNALLITFCVLLLIEPFFITYEKRYLIEEKGRYLLWYHLTMIATFGLWIYSGCAFPLLCLLFLTCARITWLAILGAHHTSSSTSPH